MGAITVSLTLRAHPFIGGMVFPAPLIVLVIISKRASKWVHLRKQNRYSVDIFLYRMGFLACFSVSGGWVGDKHTHIHTETHTRTLASLYIVFSIVLVKESHWEEWSRVLHNS